MNTNQKPTDRSALNDAIRQALSPSRRFTVRQDSRSGEITTTTQDGETYTVRDGINDALYHYATGAEPRNRRDQDAS